MTTATKPSLSTKQDRKELPIEAKNIEKGHLMMVYHFVKVEKVTNQSSKTTATLNVRNVDFKDEYGKTFDFNVIGRDLHEKCLSADLYSEEIKLSATKMIELLTTLYNVPFTVCFDKQDGSERVLRGRYIGEDRGFGRSNVEDLDLDMNEHRMRQVDHRTLKWIIVRGVKYSTK